MRDKVAQTSANDKQPTTFKGFGALRYRVIPIIPPDAKSLLSNRASFGKRPGRLLENGYWGDFHGWQRHEATDADHDLWQTWGCNIGIRTGAVGDGWYLVLIDADTPDPDHAATVQAKVEAHFGANIPKRVGKAPKAGYPLLVQGDLPYTQLTFGDPDASGRKPEVEILTGNRQFVAYGTHPSGAEYHWQKAPGPLDELPRTTLEGIEAFMEDLARVLPKARKFDPGFDRRGETSQSSLKGRLDYVQRAVRAIPNRQSLFPRREWLRIAVAIKAALADHPDEAFELFEEFSARLEDGEQGVGEVENLWDSLRPPFKLGANHLYDLARKHSGGAFGLADPWFWKPTEEEAAKMEEEIASWKAADEHVAQAREEEKKEKLRKGRASVVSIKTKPDPSTIPRRTPLIHPRLYVGEVCQCVGEPGISKSTFAIHDAICVASGEERLIRAEGASNERLHRHGPVIIYNAEDSSNEMKRRVIAAMSHHGVETLRHEIHLRSGVDGGALKLMERTSEYGALVKAAGYAELEDLIIETGAIYVILDPQVSLVAGGSENKTEDGNDLFQELADMAARNRACIMVIHHTAKNTRHAHGDIGAGRGAFSVAGKVRNMFTLGSVNEPKDQKLLGVYGRDLVRLDYGKASYGRLTDNTIVYRRHDTPVGNACDSPDSTDELFVCDAEAQLRMNGDYAPALGLVVRAQVVKPPAPEVQENQRNIAVASAVLSAMSGRDCARLTDIWAVIAAAFRQSGVSTAASQQKVTENVRLALSPDITVTAEDGNSWSLSVEREGPGQRAPWIIKASPITPKTTSQ